MPEELFDITEEYDAMLQRGMSLTGETREFFMEGRVKDLVQQLPKTFNPRRIVDFGCGLGHTAKHLAETFPGARVIGVDTSAPTIQSARELYGSPKIEFVLLSDFREAGTCDLCYMNGVMHHVEPPDRPEVLATINRCLVRGGYFSMFENNPWNPGTRIGMARVAFDRDAKVLSFLHARRLLRAAGFDTTIPVRFLFYFPRFVSFLRPLEPALAGLPLGGQYYVLAKAI
jgi:SAM-dependent methyltransferase